MKRDDHERRVAALTDLINLGRPLGEALSAVKDLPWDCETEIVQVTPTTIKRLLTQYLDGQLSTADLELWGNAVESREDIGFVSEHAELLRDVVFTIANPALNGSLTGAGVHRWLEALEPG